MSSFRASSAALAIALAATASAAWGQEPAVCSAGTQHAAAAKPAELDTGIVAVNEVAQIALRPETDIDFAAPLQKPGPAGSYGGMIAIMIPASGTYSVQQDARAWIDVVQNGVAIASSGHGHGTNCWTKAVAFPLRAGRAVVEVSATSRPMLHLLVSPTP